MKKKNNNFVGGKLKLKVKKKTTSKKNKDEIEKNKSERVEKEINKNDKEHVIKGTGRIVAVKNTIQGFETKFKEEIKIGYEIALTNPTTLQVEKRIVTSILSNKTLLVDEEYSTDINTTCSFFITKIEPKQTEATLNLSENELKYAKVIQPKEKEELVKIRKKVGMWTYKTVNKKVKGTLTNEQKLDERVKMGRDKFCW